MRYDAARAKELLRAGTGLPKAEFREGQEEAVRHLVEGRGRLLVIQRTGWGKSNLYFIACRLLREAGAGPSILISPLLSLMRNQLLAAARMGLKAVSIHSDNKEEWQHNEELLQAGEADLLLISPERLANEGFCDTVLAPILHDIAMLVIDEAHCISDWGHDFRPYYRLIERVIPLLPRSMRLLATTATANTRVMQDLELILGPGLQVQRGKLARSSLVLQNIELGKRPERMAWLAEQLPQMPGSGILYTMTVRDARMLAAWLQHCGIAAEAYYAASRRREALEGKLLQNKLKVLVATTALGMGFDKPDLAFVIHYQMPGSLVAYYQQVGRAGRALDAAYGILLYGEGDKGIVDFFIRHAFPTPEEVEAILQILAQYPQGLSEEELCQLMELPVGQFEKALALLSLEEPAPLVRQGARWISTATRVPDSFHQRARRLTGLRYAERDQMLAYTRLRQGQMSYLLRALDSRETCSQSSLLPKLTETASPELVMLARRFCQEYKANQGRLRQGYRSRSGEARMPEAGPRRGPKRRRRMKDFWLPRQ